MENENVSRDEVTGEEQNENTDEVFNEDIYDELDYDENGDVIIPDGDEDPADEDSYDDDSYDEDEEYDGEEGDEATDKGDADVKEDDPETATELLELRRKLNSLEAQARDTLTKLGVKSDDALSGLVTLAAEADGISSEEYVKNKAEEERKEQAIRLLAQQEFEKKASADLAELHAAYPETRGYKDIRELPKDILREFGRYRDMGVPAKNAYAAANPDGIRNSVADSVKARSMNDTRRHLRATVPKGARDNNNIVMPKSELERWRDIFPNRSDKEIKKLYKESIK